MRRGSDGSRPRAARAKPRCRCSTSAEVGRASADEAVATYWPAHDADHELPEPLRDFANGLVRGTLGARRRRSTRMLTAHAQNWRIERMAVIDRLVLRLAIYELLTEAETPAKVIINEALELARTFSGEEAVGVRQRRAGRGAERR